MTPPANRRILLIDDTPSIHEDFRRVLSGTDETLEIDAAEQALFGTLGRSEGVTGFNIDSAYQGHEGVAMVRASLAADRPYALAFVDMRMPPGWDGIKTIKEIWNVDPRLQIVICTAYSDYTWDQMLSELGVGDRLLVLKKPFDSIEIANLASVLTVKWDMARRAELTSGRLEAAADERTNALKTATSEIEALAHEVTQLATHDALTGLPNRIQFADRATQALAVARRDGTCPAVLMVDLDRFKAVNGTLGHRYGDLLLNEVAQRLSRVLRPSDTLARFGGDEFVFLLPDGGAEAGATVATRIARVLETPFLVGDVAVGVEASIGIAVATPGHGSTLEQLLRHADNAMRRAKADQSGFAHFAPSNDDRAQDRLTLISELRQALDCEELLVYYQPKIAIDTGEPVGVEALIRWQHPTRGLLLPGEFIALAEQSTLIKRITTFVIDSALRSCRAWLDQDVRLPVAVNVSARSLRDPAFPAIVNQHLANANVPADLLTIELTESTMMAYPGIGLTILHRLRNIGVHLSIDDYGTGYSSLSYLRNLPATELKIDREFITDLTTNPRDAAIVQSATDLGHSLGLTVVAEGIEDQATLTALNALGIDVAQGYLIARPMPEDLLRQWITDQAGARVCSNNGVTGLDTPS